MPRAAVTHHSLALLVFAGLGGCGDESVGTLGGSSGDASSTGTTAEPTTDASPTTGSPTTTDSGATDSGATGSTSDTTTGGLDPTTSGETSTSTTEPDPTTTDTGTSTTDGDSSTGEVCVEGTIVCDGDIAIVCDGRVPFEEKCVGGCIDGVGCADCVMPSMEICDGLDNDCDGVADNGAMCGPGSCSGGGGPCVELPIPPPQPLVSGCAQQFPPAQSLPCPIPEPGPVRHLSATTGDDAGDGLTPETAWATLCHAVDAAPAGSTVRVAAGQYASASVYIGKELTVKGGYDATFTTWDPDVHAAEFHGRLTLDHNAAVFGGFRMLANPLVADAWSYAHHFVGAGTLVRNYIEIVATTGGDPDVLNFYGIVASACPAGVSVLRCNDIYVRSSAPQTFVVSAVEYGNHALHAGQGVLDANRICQDGGGWATDAVGGYGSCFPQPVSLLLRNNVIESAGFGGDALSFYSCGSGDMDLTLTNNTILSGGGGIMSYNDPAVMMRWKLTNNILWGTSGVGTAIDVGTGGVEILTSEGNLTFGFQSNAILPPPLMTVGDDTSGVATPISVFVDAAGGDLHLAPGGQGVGAGINVHSLPAYGFVTTDVAQAPRAAIGAWDRGAFNE